MGASGGGGRGGLGWGILAAALAVPGFLFYNWSSRMKAEHERAISAKASKRGDSGVFQTPPPQAGRLVNPMSSSTNVPVGLPPAAAAAGTVPAAAQTPPPAMTPVREPPAAVPAAASSTASTIVLSRDPMMSPLDAVRLREAEQAEQERVRALARESQPRARRAPAPRKPIESRIELQGIVAMSDGASLAIINGAKVNPGESLRIETYPGKVRVLKITSSVVTLEYKGRIFKLRVNAE